MLFRSIVTYNVKKIIISNATFFQKDDQKQKAMTLVYNKVDLIRHDFYILGLF